jgi:predicted dehydrogenase
MNRRQFLSNSAAATVLSAGYFAAPKSVFASKSTGDRLRIGFIGTAHPHAQGKMEAVRALEELLDLVGVVEPDAKLREESKSKREYQGVKWMDESALLGTPGLQAVIVETEFADLLPTAARAVDRGLFVHLDKPPGESLKDLTKLLENAQRRNVYVQMGYMLRYNPAFDLCFKAAKEGWLGRIFELNTTMSTVRPAARRKDFFQPKGGAMFDLGSHIIDAVVTVLGPPEKVTPFGRKLYSSQDDVVDNQLAVFEYPDAIATVRATFVEPLAGDRRQFVVCGENGTLEIRPLEPPQLKLSLQKPAGKYKAGAQTIELEPMEGRYHAQLRDFAGIVHGRTKPRWDMKHDLAVQTALLQSCGLL